MKKTLWTLAALSLMGFGLVGCDAEEGDACTTNEECLSDSANMVCDSGSGTCKSINCGTGYCANTCVDAANTQSGSAQCTDKDVSACNWDTQWLDNTGLCSSRNTRTCTSKDDCEGSQYCDPKTKVCMDGEAPVEFKFVRIEDLSKLDAANQEDPGADIDAIVLTKTGGTTVYATAVKGYSRADGISADAGKKNIAANPQMAIGAPDSFVDYPTSVDKCYIYAKDKTAGAADVDRPFVSLGGKGGFLEVEMGDKIVAGDKLTVLELGKCAIQNTVKPADAGTQANSEAVKVQVSVSGDTGSWKLVGDSESAGGGIYSATITDNMLK